MKIMQLSSIFSSSKRIRQGSRVWAKDQSSSGAVGPVAIFAAGR